MYIYAQTTYNVNERLICTKSRFYTANKHLVITMLTDVRAIKPLQCPLTLVQCVIKKKKQQLTFKRRRQQCDR